jgi:hypothetical protein
MSNDKTSAKKYEYQEGQKVYFNIDGKTKGWGYVRGASALLGPENIIYSIEACDPVPWSNSAYPFSCALMFAVQLRTEPFDLSENPLSVVVDDGAPLPDEDPERTTTNE